MEFNAISKFNIGDIVYFLEDEILYEGKITSVTFKTQNGKDYNVKYIIHTPSGKKSRSEKKLSKTSDEALSKLEKIEDMRLWFRSSYNEERVIAKVKNEDEAFKEIKKFLDEHNFESYYTRTWVINGRKHFDVGSWSESFILDLNNE